MSTSSDSIDVAAIERQLTSLWKHASEDENSGVIRASMLNLITYASLDTNVGKLDEQIIEITASHPCRAIVLLMGESSESTISAEVTSRCTIPTAMTRQVCCEQVTIKASGDHIDETPSLIAPLLISDLPVYLWWRATARAKDRALFRRLVDISDRVIIDSADFNDPHTDLVKMAAALRESPQSTAFSDLNWARLTTWRALLAGFYDVAEYRGVLDRLGRVVIEHSPPAANPEAISARALLLGGWLASRLGWEFERVAGEGRPYSFVFSGGDRMVRIDFMKTDREIEPGHIARVRLESSADLSAIFSVQRSADGTRIETEVVYGKRRNVQRVLSYEGMSESTLIGREIEILGHDRVYEQAVLAVGAFISGK
jgi:glucose-6-phosphate dehydrogenase assembly protein OpcA